MTRRAVDLATVRDARRRLAEDGHTLEQVAAEQAVITEARRLKASGLALRTIAAELDRAGMVARNGRRFEAAQVQRMVAA